MIISLSWHGFIGLQRHGQCCAWFSTMLAGNPVEHSAIRRARVEKLRILNSHLNPLNTASSYAEHPARFPLYPCRLIGSMLPYHAPSDHSSGTPRPCCVPPCPSLLGRGSDRCQRLRRSQRLLWRCRHSRILRDVSARRRSEHASRVGCPWP
jgi:hypothetical protein